MRTQRNHVQAAMLQSQRIGRGQPLFCELPRPLDLRLVSMTPFAWGAVAAVYRPM